MASTMATRRLLHLFHQQLSRTHIHLSSLSSYRIVSNLCHHSRSHLSSEIQSINDDDEDEYETETETETENEYETEDHEDEEEEEDEQFVYGIDSDDEFSDNLSYDVRDDPWWNEMLPATQQKYLFMQRHKNPEAWPDQIIPHAVKTSNFDYDTISFVFVFVSFFFHFCV